MESVDWRAGVYGIHIESGLSKKDWEIVRSFILIRDDYTCFRCDKKFRSKKDLSVHHIMSRAEGGSNDKSNLITLCILCHDYVEMNEYKTKAEIMGSYDIPGVTVHEMKENKSGVREESFTRPEWHRYVYGSGRKP